jgi:hypothetical protein
MDRGSNTGRDKRFISHQSDQTGSGDHPASQSQSAGWSFPGVKQPNRKAGHSAAPNYGVNERMHISIPMCLHGVYRNNTTILLFNKHPYTSVWVTYASVGIAVLNFANKSRNVCSTYDTVSLELFGVNNAHIQEIVISSSGIKFTRRSIIIIIYLSWSWATCWPVPVSRI